MKKIIFILITLISLKIIGQDESEIKVTYIEKLNFDLPISKVSELIFNNRKSYYIEKKSKENFDNFEMDNVTVQKSNSSFNKTINVDLEKDSIFMKVMLNENLFLVQEKLNKIAWKIHEKMNDTILGFKSTKATGYFRGRTYTAWFAEEIPTKFGPWKLHGLPGLILEVKDNLNEVQFIAEKIEYIKKSILDFNFHKIDNKYKKLSLKEYDKKFNKEMKLVVQRIISKLPKGSSVNNLKFIKYKGLELKYEWEEK